MIAEDAAQDWVAKLPLPGDSSAAPRIELTSYAPNKMVYTVSDLAKDQLAVFSEIFYEAPGQRWKATVNGEELDILRANYVLRAAVIPAGATEVIFEFHPDTYYTGEKIDLACSILLLLAVGGAVYAEQRRHT